MKMSPSLVQIIVIAADEIIQTSNAAFEVLKVCFLTWRGARSDTLLQFWFALIPKTEIPQVIVYDESKLKLSRDKCRCNPCGLYTSSAKACGDVVDLVDTKEQGGGPCIREGLSGFKRWAYCCMVRFCHRMTPIGRFWFQRGKLLCSFKQKQGPPAAPSGHPKPSGHATRSNKPTPLPPAMFLRLPRQPLSIARLYYSAPHLVEAKLHNTP